MRATRVALGLIASVLLLTPQYASAVAWPAGPDTTSRSKLGGAPPRPNIVVFYLDDVAPHDGRLWNDPARTPATFNNFVEHGVKFTNAINESPLCCPGRGGFLTGLHTHNNGVDRNNGRLMNPSVHIGTALKAVGYETMWLGKYLNVFQSFTNQEWQRHMVGWDHMEATWRYTDRVRTENGWVTYTGQHPTKIIGDRTAELIRDADPDKPIFAVVAPHNLHSPNKPMPLPQSELDKCVGMPRWNPPNYNEQDVSDKPAYVRKHRLLSAANGYAMRRNCEAMIGVDTAVQKVVNALASENRLDNTLLVFTADNGMDWGAHRLLGKSTPYSTPVPLYMSWPARWGTAARTINEHVSNIDLAPTFCEYAGCTLGPYATGQARPDGVSYAGLLDGTESNLGRDALLETLGNKNGSAPAWWAVRTTAENPMGLWHYVRYSTGELELYDLDADPYEMSNAAYKSAFAGIVGDLEARLDELRNEGRVDGPDATIGVPGTNQINGYNVFDDFETTRSTTRVTGAVRSKTYVFKLWVDNNSGDVDTLVVNSLESGSTAITVRYRFGGNDVTAAILGSGLVLGNIPRDGRRILEVRMTVGSTTPRGASKKAVIHVESQSDPELVDVVTAITRR